jgi:hypothetical protein
MNSVSGRLSEHISLIRTIRECNQECFSMLQFLLCTNAGVFFLTLSVPEKNRLSIS